jgi:hypothetical protein
LNRHVSSNSCLHFTIRVYIHGEVWYELHLSHLWHPMSHLWHRVHFWQKCTRTLFCPVHTRPPLHRRIFDTGLRFSSSLFHKGHHRLLFRMKSLANNW